MKSTVTNPNFKTTADRGGKIQKMNSTLREKCNLPDWNFTVNVNNKDISKADLGIPNLRASRRLIHCLFNVLNTSSYCGRLPVFQHDMSHDAFPPPVSSGPHCTKTNFNCLKVVPQNTA